MHFEFLVEDVSGENMLGILLPKLLSSDHTFNIHSYKGIGKLPKNLKPSSDPQKRILLDQLPRLIQGYGRTFAGYPEEYSAALIVVCDLDSRCLSTFRQELIDCLNKCNTPPQTYFCIAVEEGEAWFLGDLAAVKIAYPNAKDAVLNSYANDSICGTWEILADAVFPGGSNALASQGWQAIGKEKTNWAMNITPHMKAEYNKSPSFCYFRDKLRQLFE